MIHDPRQRSFEGFGRPARDMFYFALLPDRAAAVRAGGILQGIDPAHPRRDWERLHLTLLYLGRWDGMPRTLERRAAEAADRLETGRFAVRLDRAGLLGNPPHRPDLVLRNADPLGPLLRFRSALAQAAAMSRLGRRSGGFMPHMTLFYGWTGPFVTRPVEPVEWQARDFVLVRSIVDEGRHEHLARWPLRH